MPAISFSLDTMCPKMLEYEHKSYVPRSRKGETMKKRKLEPVKARDKIKWEVPALTKFRSNIGRAVGNNSFTCGPPGSQYDLNSQPG